MKNNFKDLTGMTFNFLTVIARAENKGKDTMWLCQCVCKNLKVVRGDMLKSGSVKSCGCYRRKYMSEKQKGNFKHNLSKTRIYKIWHGMVKRCANIKHFKYQDYGARGIKVCDEWANDFMNFYNWSMEHGYTNKLTIERIDNDGNYEPSNCAWKTRVEQNLNKRTTHYITINGVTKSMTEWAKAYNISPQAMYHRIKNGWAGEELLKPMNKNLQHFKRKDDVL